MSNIPVYLTAKLPDSALKVIKSFSKNIIMDDSFPTKAQIIKNARNAHGILCTLFDRIDPEIIDACPRLGVISLMAAGYDNIVVDHCKKRGIIVTNVPEVLTETTADLVFAIILAVARRIVEADRFVRKGLFKGWKPDLFCGYDVWGKTLGIIGAGRIGQAVARRAKGFSMKIIYYSITRKSPFERQTGARFVNLETLLKNSDFISINCPLNEKTYHLINEKELKMMKPSAILINTARGPVVNEKALAKALKEGRIAGAGLDVYENEPQITRQLLKLDNVTLLPHIGSASHETRTKMAEIAALNLVNVLMGLDPIFRVV